MISFLSDNDFIKISKKIGKYIQHTDRTGFPECSGSDFPVPI